MISADRMTDESIKQALASSAEPQHQGEMLLALIRSAAAGREQTVSGTATRGRCVCAPRGRADHCGTGRYTLGRLPRSA